MVKNDVAKNKVPALSDLFEWNTDGVHIRSARCNSCGTYFFPEYHEQHRPGCSRENVENVLLNKIGKLASYTIQYYMPPLPFKTEVDITPYKIGMVEFSEGIQVAGILVECEEADLVIGKPFETTTFSLYQNEKGSEMVTWAFKPCK